MQTAADGKFDLFSECCLYVRGEALNQANVEHNQPLWAHVQYLNINEWSVSSKSWALCVCVNNCNGDKIKQFEMGGVCGMYEG